jgi:hypothetical protein
VPKSPRVSLRDYNDALRRTEALTGRELVIVGAAFLDHALEVLLESVLDPEFDVVRREVIAGPLAGLSRRLDFALSMGLIGPLAHKEGRQFAVLRNRAAHDFTNVAFQEDVIAGWSLWKMPTEQGRKSDLTCTPYEAEGVLDQWRVDGDLISSATHNIVQDAGGSLTFFLPAPEEPYDKYSDDDVVRHEIWALCFVTIGQAVERWIEREG